MSRRGQRWRDVLGVLAGVLATPVLIVLALPLAILAAVATYGRAVVMGGASILRLRRQVGKDAKPAPHFAEPPRIPSGQPTK